MAGIEEVLNTVMGKEETAQQETIEKPAEEPLAEKPQEPAKETTTKPEEKPAAEPPPAPEKPQETPAKPQAEETDLEAELAKLEKPTGPGGVPSGALRDLQEERRARQEAEQRARELEARIAALEVSKAPAAGQKAYSVQDLIDQGRITADDVVTAGMQAEINRNCRERDAAEKSRQEQEGKRAVQTLTETAAAQEEQAAAALSPQRVGVARSYERIVAMGRPLLTQKDAQEIAGIIQAGGNGAVELYKRCQQAIVREYPTLKETIFGKPKAPETKPKEKPPAKEVTQERILATSDPEAARELLLGPEPAEE